MSVAVRTETPITRDDIESRFRELQSGLDEGARTAKSYALAAGAVVVVGVAAATFLLGRRRGRKRTTVVEVRRV